MKDELVNALDQLLKIFHLDEETENQSKNSVDDQSYDDLNDQVIQLKRSDKEQCASKLAERMIQYDSRKKMPRTDMIIRDKFSYKKILKCLIHMTRVLVTLGCS